MLDDSGMSLSRGLDVLFVQTYVHIDVYLHDKSSDSVQLVRSSWLCRAWLELPP